ncbi:hypothetical protein [Pseudofrankia sp. DC12]|uniref:hypothetical protein n=1 Tax=Pseudofrankia sp. DC12 TaxID=683315 RepID=UPI0005F7DDF9|nr:hypothetical protein [Pseudofrankia sp. DC12]
MPRTPRRTPAGSATPFSPPPPGLDLAIVTTGIANPAQARELAAAGCQLGTGPLYGPPHSLRETVRRR